MTLPTFDEFFRALHDDLDGPFPWQSALADRVERDGWPDEIGIPTGLGKTTCLDIGVWAMAVSEEATRRLWYVVNRRLLVDAAHERATLIEERLRHAGDGPLGAIRAALLKRGALGVDGPTGATPLHVARLRGGVPLDTSAPDPSQPTLLLATVPMFASRLLLRGYGVSRGMRPIAAAHAGTDSTVLLDEAHLSQPLQRLMEPLAQCDRGKPDQVLPGGRARPRLVALTATGHQPEDRFELTDQDGSHPVVRQRLDAAKPTRLTPTTTRRLAATLAEQALGLLDGGGSTCVVFVNTARLAPDVVTELKKQSRRHDAAPEIRLLTGRLRAPDAEAVRAALLAGPGAVHSGWDRDRARPLVVVATQTLEVGADLDFEHIVTETAGVRALVQRFGRCNRLGTRNDVASAAIVHPTDRNDHPIYGEEVDEVWHRLQELAEATADRTVDMGPAHVGALGPPGDAPQRVPSLLPHHLWEWAKTSLDQTPPTPVEPFFSGLDDPVHTVSVLWRWWVPQDGNPVFPPPAMSEVVDVPLWEVRDLLESARDGTWCRLSVEELTAEHTVVGRIRPGDTVVLSSSLGWYSPDIGWSPDSSDAVPDLSVTDGFLPLLPRPGGLVALPQQLAEPALGTEETRSLLAAIHDRETLPEEETEELPTTDELVVRLVARLREADEESSVLLDRWHPVPRVRVAGDVVVLTPPPARTGFVRPDVRVDAFDDLSFDQTSTALEQHLGSVGEAAARIATLLGLPERLVEAVRLAGALHDVGKADRRFQQRLDPDDVRTEPLAKSTPTQHGGRHRTPSGWPRRGRHEELSGRAVRAWFDEFPDEVPDVDQDLVLHLVVSHHGHGRSLVRPVDEDRFAAPLKLPVHDQRVLVDGDLSRTDWEQPARFRHLCVEYGVWGLALLESIVRQADHAASAAARRGAGE